MQFISQSILYPSCIIQIRHCLRFDQWIFFMYISLRSNKVDIWAIIIFCLLTSVCFKILFSKLLSYKFPRIILNLYPKKVLGRYFYTSLLISITLFYFLTIMLLFFNDCLKLYLKLLY